MPRFKIESKIDGDLQQLYQELFTIPGVNYELMPVAKMTAPVEWSTKHLKDWPTGRELFTSLVLLFGIIPVDLHRFKLLQINGSEFREGSSTLLHTEWNHTRSIQSLGSVCLVTDELEFIPKLSLMGSLMEPVYKAIFNHRHKRLKAKYRSVR